MGKYKPYPDYSASVVPWLGQLPSDWAVVRVKFVAELINEKVEPDVSDRFIGLENVASWTGRYLEPGEVTKPEGVSNRYYSDCVLFGKLRPYLAKSLRVVDQGICSSEFLVLRSRKVISRFLQYFTLTDVFIREVDSSTYGAKMPRASWEFVGSIPTPVPSKQEQEVLVDFLGHETAKIDRLIARQERLIELLKEKRQAVISHAVTKGLNPGAPMKDSGVESLGEVPEEWGVVNLSYVLHAIGDVDHYMPQSVERGIPYVMTGDLEDLASSINFGDCKQVSHEDYLKLSKKIKNSRGDVILARYATIGTASYIDVDIDFLVSYSCVTIKPNISELMSPEFVS